jgi:hypothetical protein
MQLLDAFAPNVKFDMGNSKSRESPTANSLDSGRSIASVASAALARQAASGRLPSATTCAGVLDSLSPDWDRYAQENSWEENATRIFEAYNLGQFWHCEKSF